MKKLTKILGLVAVLSLLIGILPMSSAQPASAAIGTFSFGTITTPMSSPIIYTTSEVSTFAVTSNGTMFVADWANNTLRRGGGWGAGWATITTYFTGAGGTFPIWKLVAAPDDPNFILAVSSTAAGAPQEIWVSFDQGFTWSNTGFTPAAATEVITDVAVSAKYPVAGGDARDILVCTDGATAAPPSGGRILALKLQPYGVTTWTVQAGFPAATSFRAIKAAPAYAGDFTFIAVGAQAAGTVAVLGVRDINANTTNYAVSTAFPMTITATATIANLVSADIAFPSDYQGQVDRMRRFWVALDCGAAATPFNTGIFRVDGRSVSTNLFLLGRPWKMAYSGTVNAGKMLVGTAEGASASGTTSVYRSLNAQSNAVTWDLPYKGPSGGFGIPVTQEARSTPMWKFDGKEAVVGTMTTDVVNTPALYFNFAAAVAWRAGAANDESALSVTADDGDVYNQYNSIDTRSRGITDYVVSGNTRVMYLATANDPAGLDSIWKSTNGPGFSSWTRVGLINAGGQPILKLAPEKDDGSVVFWGDRGSATNIIQRSVDGGNTWSNCMPGITIQDFAVTDQNTILAVTAGGIVRKGTSTGPGWMWTANYDPRMGSAHRIVAIGNNAVIAPGGAGMTFPAYSTDGGLTFVRIMYRPADMGANVLHYAAMDPKFADNKTFFLGSAVPGAAPAALAVGDTVTLPVSWPAATAGTFIVPVGPITIVQGATTFVSQGPVTVTLPATTTAWTAGTAKVLAATEIPGMIITGFFNMNGSTGNVWRWTIGKNTTGWDFIGAPLGAMNTMIAPASGWLFTGVTTPAGGVLRSIDALNGHPKPGVNWNALIAGLPGAFSVGNIAISMTTGNVNIYTNDVKTVNSLYGFIDQLADVAPGITEPKLPPGADAVTLPVAFTGFANAFGIHWNLPAAQSATYQAQISATPDFSDIVTAVGPLYAPPNPGSPSWFIGNPQAVGIMGGNTYYIRVRVDSVDTGQAILSPWSKALKVVVQSGVPVQAPYSAPQPVSPAEGTSLVAPTSVGFTWTPMPGATEYKFVLATDAALTKTLVSTTVTGTAYSYDTALKEGTYFWQVTQTKPIPSSPSPVASFVVVAKPAPAPTPVINVPTPQVVVQPPPPAVTPVWVWVVIAIGAILVVVTIVLIFRTRKV